MESRRDKIMKIEQLPEVPPGFYFVMEIIEIILPTVDIGGLFQKNILSEHCCIHFYELEVLVMPSFFFEIWSNSVMYQSLFKVLNYKFEDISLLELALSHKSLGSKDNNERPEFLGDAILGAVIAEELFLKFPDITEGQMTRIRFPLSLKDPH